MKNISIGFTGDIAFSEYTKNLYETPEKIDEEIYEFLNSNDYNIINFESPITNFLKTKKMALAHRSDINSLNFIKLYHKYRPTLHQDHMFLSSLSHLM